MDCHARRIIKFGTFALYYCLIRTAGWNLIYFHFWKNFLNTFCCLKVNQIEIKKNLPLVDVAEIKNSGGNIMKTRDEFVVELKNQLDELNTGIKKIEHKVKSARDTGKVKLRTRVKDLRKMRDAALSKLQEVKNTSDETWQNLKQDAENVINSLKDALAKTMANFKKRTDEIITRKVSD